LASAFVLALLVFGLVDAPRGQADAPGTAVAFWVKASNDNAILGIASSGRADGRGSIVLFVFTKGAYVVYSAPATVVPPRAKRVTVVPSQAKAAVAIHPPSAVRADLGALGRIDLAFAPSGVVKRERACDKTTFEFEAGSYQGTFEFHGEEGYAEATVASLPALFRPLLDFACGGVGYRETSGPDLPGAKLRLHSKRDDPIVSLQANKNRPGAAMTYEATIGERSGGVEIQRTVQGRAPAASLVPSNGLRLATFEPPAPFDGRAVFRRNASPPNRWTGDLTVDFPGKPDVSLTHGFDATLVPAELITERRRGGR
jgi:hypothetical protein